MDRLGYSRVPGVKAPNGRYAVRVPPSLDSDAYYDAPPPGPGSSKTSKSKRSRGLDWPRSFRNDLRFSVGASGTPTRHFGWTRTTSLRVNGGSRATSAMGSFRFQERSSQGAPGPKSDVCWAIAVDHEVLRRRLTQQSRLPKVNGTKTIAANAIAPDMEAALRILRSHLLVAGTLVAGTLVAGTLVAGTGFEPATSGL
jgi:hypothetical protein